MRKSVFVGFGLALALAGSVAAQAPDTGAMRRGHGKAHRGQVGRMDHGPGMPGGFLLRGITLSDAQKTQLKSLRASQRERTQSSRVELRKQMEEARAARQRGDTAAVGAIMRRNRDAMTREREQNIATIRNILTAEQRIQFDKNVAELKQRATERAERFGRKGQRGPRGHAFGRGA